MPDQDWVRALSQLLGPLLQQGSLTPNVTPAAPGVYKGADQETPEEMRQTINQGMPHGLQRNRAPSYIGNSVNQSLGAALSAYLTQAFFTGKLSAEQVYEELQDHQATYPFLPSSFADETLRNIGYRQKLNDDTRTRELEKIPEAFDERGTHDLPLSG